MEWILVICTSGWGLCGHVREITYPNEAACYRALDDLYRRNKPYAFKYVVCQPKALNKPANASHNRRGAVSASELMRLLYRTFEEVQT